MDRATCSIEGPSVPWPIYLKVWRDKGKPPDLIRKVDMVLGELGDDLQRHFDIGTFDKVVKDFIIRDGTETAHLYK